MLLIARAYRRSSRPRIQYHEIGREPMALRPCDPAEQACQLPRVVVTIADTALVEHTAPFVHRSTTNVMLAALTRWRRREDHVAAGVIHLQFGPQMPRDGVN